VKPRGAGTAIGERPAWSRGDRVNVDGIGVALAVLSVKPGATAWWVECRAEDGRTWNVPAERTWTP
jgi:hypothetical protein